METRTTYNGTVEIACDSGHELAGSPVRKCQDNGQWSGESAVCQGNVSQSFAFKRVKL